MEHRVAQDDSIDRMYEKAILNIFTGNDVNVRTMETREILGHTVILNDVRNNILVSVVRDLNPKFMVAEWLWMMYGLSDVPTIAQYNSKIAQFSDDGKTFAGAYGPKIINQLAYVQRCFDRDKNTRQAIINIWRENPTTSRDVPCTLNFQFIMRDGRLNGIVNMRSSDGWLGLPYDTYNFSQIVHYVAWSIGEKPGFLQMNLGSSHLYDRDWIKARDLMGSALAYFRTPAFSGEPGIPYKLKTILRTPDAGELLSDLPSPWCYYARVLMARNKQRAYEVLFNFAIEGGDEMPEENATPQQPDPAPEKKEPDPAPEKKESETSGEAKADKEDGDEEEEDF